MKKQPVRGKRRLLGLRIAQTAVPDCVLDETARSILLLDRTRRNLSR